MEPENPIFIPIFVRENILSKNISTSLPKHHDNIIDVRQTSKQEAFQALPFRIKFTLSVLMAISLLIGSYFKSIMYRYVFTANRTNRGWMHRPINILTITSAIIHHLTHVSIGTWYIVILTTEAPLGNETGIQYCQIMDVIGVYGIIYLSVGSLGTAVYRVLYINFEYFVKYVVGEQLLLGIIWSLSISTCAGLVYLFTLETSSHRTQMNMCTGLSVTDTQILIDYALSHGSPLIVTSTLQFIVTSVCISIQTIEFCIYVWFFWTRYRNDNGSITRLLTQDIIRDRNIKNVSTFIGQFYGFAMEYAFLGSLLFFVNFADEHTNQFKAITVMVKFMDFGLLSSVEVLSSPGLRSFMR